MYNNLQQNDVRIFFFDVYDKYIKQQPLSALEVIALEVIQQHPEYLPIMKQKDRYLDYQYLPESGETNPFLHMSMHISIKEQISINQPFGIVEYYNKLLTKYQDEMVVEHHIMDCLGEMIWYSQKNQVPFDTNIYFTCLSNKIK